MRGDENKTTYIKTIPRALDGPYYPPVQQDPENERHDQIHKGAWTGSRAQATLQAVEQGGGFVLSPLAVSLRLVRGRLVTQDLGEAEEDETSKNQGGDREVDGSVWK